MKPFRSISFAFAAAMATSVALAAWQAPAPEPSAPRAGAPQAQGGRSGAPLKSPEVGSDRRVTFRLRAPNAKEVAVSMGGRRLPMQKDDQGVWSATSDGLAPDIYTYSFIVDGATITDPANRDYQTSFAGFQNMFFVPGPQPWLPQPGVPRGAVSRHPFHSKVANDDREFFVYTPPGYEARRSQPYPVFYLLHGLGDDAGRWVNAGAANVILDNLIAAKQAVPMVMVTTLGYGVPNGPAGARGAQNLTGYTRSLLEEVMPAVEKEYNVSKDRQQRAIAGLSMGGAEALYTVLNHPDKFAWAGSFSGAFVMWQDLFGPPPSTPPPAAAPPPAPGRGGGRGGPAPTMTPADFAKTFPSLDRRINSQLRMLWIACGTADGLITVNRQFKDWLKSKDIQFTEQEIPDMAHVWPLWRQNVADMAPKLFRDKSR